MKKNYFLLALLVALFSVSSSYADTYKVDFEQAADTTDPEFRVDAGWGSASASLPSTCPTST